MRLLIVEDSDSLGRSLRHGLEPAGWRTTVAADGAAALDLLASSSFDVLLLDLMLPKKSGLAVLQELRRVGNQLLVLVLSARDRVEDRIRALELGADDYLVKPFSFDELEARLRALWRRRYARTGPKISLGTLEVDLEDGRVSRGGDNIHLAPGQMALLELLLLRRGQVVSQETILQEAHPQGDEIGSNVVEVLVSHLRRKLGAEDGRLIQTRRGLGYLIE
jgi:DNA-binding response OmpR family regulator